MLSGEQSGLRSIFKRSDKWNIDSVLRFLRDNRWNIFALIAIVSVSVVLYIGNVIQVNSLIKEVHQMKKGCEELKNRNIILHNKLAELESPDRILTIATERLGMVRSDKAPQIVP